MQCMLLYRMKWVAKQTNILPLSFIRYQFHLLVSACSTWKYKIQTCSTLPECVYCQQFLSLWIVFTKVYFLSVRSCCNAAQQSWSVLRMCHLRCTHVRISLKFGTVHCFVETSQEWAPLEENRWYEEIQYERQEIN